MWYWIVLGSKLSTTTDGLVILASGASGSMSMGRRWGSAPLSGALRVPLDPGHHVVRVRLWWYLSPRVETDSVVGHVVRFEADNPRQLPVLRRMARMALRPFHSLSLTALPDQPVLPDAP